MDHTGLTPFLEAATTGHKQVCEVLCQHLHGPGQCLEDGVGLHSCQKKNFAQKNAAEFAASRAAPPKQLVRYVPTGFVLYSGNPMTEHIMYSGGSNTEHSNSESIRKPNVLKVGNRMVRTIQNPNKMAAMF